MYCGSFCQYYFAQQFLDLSFHCQSNHVTCKHLFIWWHYIPMAGCSNIDGHVYIHTGGYHRSLRVHRATGKQVVPLCSYVPRYKFGNVQHGKRYILDARIVMHSVCSKHIKHVLQYIKRLLSLCRHLGQPGHNKWSSKYEH